MSNTTAPNGHTYGYDSSNWLVPWRVKNDYSGDGISDILFMDTNTNIAIDPNALTLQFWIDGLESNPYPASPSSYATYPFASYSYAGSGDFNGDGTADVFFTQHITTNGNDYYNTLIWETGNDGGIVNSYAGATGFEVAAICDTNGDGQDDVIWFNKTTGVARIWPSANKSAVTYPGTQTTTGLLPVGCADFDGDGQADLLFVNASSGATQYWKGSVKGQGVIYPGSYDNTTYSFVGTGDFDGDGKADILFSRASNNGTMIWSGAVKSPSIYPGTGASGYTTAVIGDYNGDGKADLLWTNSITFGTVIWPGASSSAVHPYLDKTAATIPGSYSSGYTPEP
jgi:hypothetical protein